jgi:hypothetical protein
MTLIDTIKGWGKKGSPKTKKNTEEFQKVTVDTMEELFEKEDLVGAAKDLKMLLEYYGRGKKKNHRYKGREFMFFILSNKHKELKNTGYKHWQNVNQIIQLNQQKVYPFNKKNLREAMDFFEKEIRGISAIKITLV